MKRKDFLKMGSMMALTAGQLNANATHPGKGINKMVDFLHDGLVLSPKEYASLLMKLADEGKVKPDFYSNGGVVEEMENKFAALLGKESAVFMPTGTLANHIAIRRLAGENRRVIVQEQSHIYQDTGDCAQMLSGLNLVALGNDTVSFSVKDIETVVSKSSKGRVETRVGVIAIESPVRRQFDRMVPLEALTAMSKYGKTNGIKIHLDGARLFVQAVHEQNTPAKYGSLCDTVFTSLWKCFNAPSGAVLAGSKEFTTNLFHERRMFGGGLPAAWPLAAVALHYADSFITDYKSAWVNAEKLFASLEKNEKFKLIKFDDGSHIVRLNVMQTDLARFREALAKRNVAVGAPDNAGFLLKINPSLNRDTAENLAGIFTDCLKSK